MRRAFLPCTALLLALCGRSTATDYTWTASGSNLWTTSSAWSPSGNPSTASDTATFNASGLGSCTLTAARSISSFTVESGYTGTILLLGSGAITAPTVNVAGGTITGGATAVRATQNLNVSGGTFVSLLLDGNGGPAAASVTGTSTGSLRFEGTTSLTGTGTTPQTIAAMNVASGTCSVTDTFIAGSLSVAAGAVLETQNLSGVAIALHSISGEVRLKPGSGIAFTNNANLTTGTINASEPGSVVVCNGDWLCTTTYLTSGTPASALTILQNSTGSTVNHGTNPADLVAIQNGPGRTTTWNSTNDIVALTVAQDSTLVVAAGRVLSVPGTIANAGLIQEVAPGHIHHAADALGPVDDGILPLPEVPAGASFRVRLLDADEALDALSVDTATGITVTNPRNGDTEALAAVETDAATAIFVTPLVPTEEAGPANPGDGILQVLPGDTLAIAYVDGEDGADNAAAASLPVVGSSRVGGWTAHGGR